MGFANLEHFLVCLFAVPQFFQNAADRAEADVYMKFFGKDILDLPQAEGRIRQYFLGVSIGTAVHNFLYMPFDIWDVVLEFFRPAPWSRIFSFRSIGSPLSISLSPCLMV